MMAINPQVTERRAAKSHECFAAIEYRRLHQVNDRVKPCVRGGDLIERGELYYETEGEDPFHPARYHVACLPWEMGR